jgi:hypothetical protein
VTSTFRPEHSSSAGERREEVSGGADRIKHGWARRGSNRSPEYGIWAGMIQRCHNSHQALYSYYGARGITVHPDWRGPGGFERFLEHMGRRPSPIHSVDRIDNSRGYEPGNVRWATRTEQMLNTRRARIVELNGERLPLKLWCEKLGLPYKAVHLRITRRGMTPEQALTVPMRGHI